MARQSSIDRLPDEVQAEIGRLRQKGHTIDDILAHLRGLEGIAEISRSALGRHVKEMDEIGERLRFGRQIAEMLNRHIDGAPGSSAAQVNIELMQTQVVEMLMKLEQGVTLDADAFSKMCKGIADLTRASKTNVDFIAKAEQRAAERAAERAKQDAAAAVESVARERGLTAPTIDAIKAQIFGVKAGTVQHA